jgi:anaerobic magnesium-protoporphyrin IX monomethyl ester cyclase
MTDQPERPSVVLLNPPADVVREPLHDTPRHPAIGIAYVGGYLWRETGIRPHVIDGKLGRRAVRQVIKEITALRPRVLGISAMTHMIMTSGEIAREVKVASPETVVVVGGFHASFLPERTLQEFPDFDLIVVGEGEIAFTKLVRAILEDESCDGIPGVAFRRHGEIRVNGRGEIPDHLDKSGIPAWELFPKEDLDRYATLYPVMSQRGCPFNCNFCSRPYGRDLRTRSVEHVVGEMKRNVSQFGAREMTFYDETFTVDKQYIMDLCASMVETGLSRVVKWTSMVHANTITPDLLASMREAGCQYLAFGVESGDDDIIKAMKKGITKERILLAATMIRKSRIPWGSYFILGHPHETKESCMATIDLAVRLNANVTCFGIMVPYPGTEVWEMAIRGQAGYKIISDRWEDFNKQIGNALELENLSRKTLERLQLEGYLKVYLYNWRFRELFQILVQHRKRLYYKIRQFISPRRKPVGRIFAGDFHDPTSGRTVDS